MESLQRLSLLSSHLTASDKPAKAPKARPIDDVWASVSGDQFLSAKGVQLRQKTRALMESLEVPLQAYINKTEFPHELLPALRDLGVNGYHIKDFGGPGLSSVEAGAICYELARIDASMMTFLTVHNSIGMAVVDYLGSEEQRQRILPDGIALRKILCFGLTEADYGSDATGLQTTAKRVEGGYVINGEKRWIGNATFADYIIIWAKNVDDNNKIQGFLVEKGSKGLSTKKIENKYALRMVQNADIKLENVFVPEHNKLAKADDFATGTNKILEHSRIKVCWGAVGIASGAYEAALKYTMERKQFGRPIAQFQLSQLKLSKMLAMCESMLVMVIHLSQAYEQGKTSIGQIGRTKSHCTQVAREVCAMARDLCGGNGILLENRVMKAFMDIEAIHTYEGTYEVNMLVSGREITGGLNAIKGK